MVAGDLSLGAIEASKSLELQLGLSWDYFPGQPHIDLDCAALIMDWGGVVHDACYYNNLICSGGSETNHSALKHSGDNRDGRVEGFDEIITIDLNALPHNVACIALVVNAFSGGTFSDVETAFVNVSAVSCDEKFCSGAAAADVSASQQSPSLADYRYSLLSLPSYSTPHKTNLNSTACACVLLAALLERPAQHTHVWYLQ